MSQTSVSPDLACSLDFLGDRWRSPEFRNVWKQLLQSRDNHDVLYQTPEFFEHLHAVEAPDLSVLAVTAPDGTVAGVVPLRMIRWPLTFGVSGRVLAKSNLRAVVVLGSQPLIPSDPALHDRLFATIGQAFPAADAIVMGSVPVDSFLWRYCHESAAIRQQFLVYIPNGVRSCHTIPLPKTFDEYLAKLGAKRRYNLRRQVRRLCDFAKDTLELRRITALADVPLLVDALDSIKRGLPWNPGVERSTASSTAGHATFADLAARGLLACYLMFCDQRPVAVAIGMQYEHTYSLLEMAHDSSLAALSPGSTMLFMLLEDLVRHHTAVIDLGYGEPAYRHRSTNIAVERGGIVLLRKTFANRLRQTGHATFQSGVTLLKQLFRGPSPTPDE